VSDYREVHGDCDQSLALTDTGRIAIVTRRDILSCAAAVVVRPVLAANPAAVESISIISQQPEFYHGWPTIAADRQGNLLVVCSGGREAHICPFGRVELIRSSDAGRTWSWPEVILDTPIDDRDAGICVTPSGTILVTTFTSLAYEPILNKAKDWPADRLARWHAANQRTTEKQRHYLLDTWMLRSTDGGLIWSAPFRVPLNSPHGPTALSDGRLLYAGKQLWLEGTKVGVCESKDDGETWTWLSDIPARPSDQVAAYHELHAVEAANGTILVHIRNHNTANQGETLQCESHDGGKSWTVPHPIGVWGLPSHLLRLRDGRLLMSYGYRREPFGNVARVSSDHGKTWSEPIVISNDGPGVDLGYPSTIELPDGKLVTVWYESTRELPHAVLRKARWTLGGVV
jgi:sialidase-1